MSWTKKNYKDLTGQQFGRLIVLEIDEEKTYPKHIYWKCKCQCGNIKSISRSHLISGAIKSCGCLKKDKLIKYNIENKSKTNQYDLSGEHGVGYTSNTHKEFYFDLEDYGKIKNYCWSEHIIHNNYSALETRIENNVIRFSWIVSDKGVDHINRNPLDNRKQNFRNVNNRENAINHKMRKDNSSGVTGVNYNKALNKWVARINVENKTRITIYTGDSFDDAVKARLEAEKIYYGEYSPLEVVQ